MRCFHRTPYGEAILKNGFQDGEAMYMTNTMFRGVWLSDRPLTSFEGFKRNDLLSLEIPDEALAELEWIEEGKPYRAQCLLAVPQSYAL